MNAKDWRNKTKEQKEKNSNDVTLPSGMVVKLRFVTLETFIVKGGRLPQNFVQKMAKLLDEPSSPKRGAVKDLNFEDTITTAVFVREVVREGLVWPRIVEGASPDSESEIDPSEITEEDFYFIFSYCSGQLSKAMVNTKKGGATVGAVERFPDGGRRNVRSNAGNNVSEIQQASRRHNRAGR